MGFLFSRFFGCSKSKDVQTLIIADISELMANESDITSKHANGIRHISHFCRAISYKNAFSTNKNRLTAVTAATIQVPKQKCFDSSKILTSTFHTLVHMEVGKRYPQTCECAESQPRKKNTKNPKKIFFRIFFSLIN